MIARMLKIMLLTLLMLAGSSHAVTYDYANRTQGVNVFAYRGDSSTVVPSNSTTPSSQLTNIQYDNIEVQDGNEHQVDASSNNNHPQMRFVIRIDESETTVTALTPLWRGRGVNSSNGRDNGALLYIFNYATGAYQQLVDGGDTENTVNLSTTLSANLVNYIDETSGNAVTFYVVSRDKRTGNKSNSLYTDYFKLDVTAAPALPAVTDAGGACVAENIVVVKFAADANPVEQAKLSNYGINNGAAITGVVVQDSKTSILTVNALDPALNYTITAGTQSAAVRTSGALGSYYDQRSGSGGAKVNPQAGIFTGTRFYSQDPQINFSWNNATPAPFPQISGNGDKFSIRWDAYLVPAAAGTYNFRTYSDDGIRVYLNGAHIITTEWNDHGPRYSSASAGVDLNAGQAYLLKVEHYENGGRAYAQLEWRRNGGAWQNVPTGNLSSCAVPLPNASVDDVTVAAGSTADFTVTLDAAATADVVISYSTSDDTAVAGTDYTAATGSVTIPAGQTTATISIATLNGGQVADVKFQLNITSSGVSVTDGTGVGTITPSGAPSGNLTGKLNVDNRFSAYISTSDSLQGVLIGSGNDWPTTVSLAASLVAGQDYYLHIFAEDLGGVAGFLGDFALAGGTHLFENGATSLTTNTSDWRVSKTGWSGYVPASGYGLNGVAPWGVRPAVDANATWIWSADNNADNINYFTTKITAISNSTFLHFAFEQEEFSGGGVVIEDYSKNGNNGVTVGNVESTTEGKVCSGAIIGDNNSHSIIDGINSGVDLDSAIGNAGTIMFWYKAKEAWNGSGDRTLMDASAGNKYFFLSKMNNGSLRFWLEDSADRDFQYNTAAFGFGADTWVHLAVTWDMGANSMKVYVNGAEALNRTMNSTGQIGNLGNLIFGDNSSTTYKIAPGSSANGTYDDIRIDSSVLNIGQIAILMAKTFPCSGIDDVTVAAGEKAEFTVTLGEPATSNVVISYMTRDGTALSGTDYIAASGTITIATGQTTGTISVDTLNASQTADVQFYVDITSTDVTITNASGKGTITPPASCTLGGFAFVQPGYALACPSTRAEITITAMCDDGVTVKEDYDGEITLSASADPNGQSAFYDASSGGSLITSYQYSVGNAGVATVYLYHNNEHDAQVSATDAAASITSTSAGSVKFRTKGFQVSTPANYVCGTTANLVVTALGQNETATGCDIIEGFTGNKALKVWSEINVDPSPSAADSGLPVSMQINSNPIADARPGTANVNAAFAAGVATLTVGYSDVGEVQALNILHDAAPYDGTVPELGELVGSPGQFVVYPAQVQLAVTTANSECVAANGGCSPFVAAGANFSITGKAVCNDLTTTAPSYQGVVGLSHSLKAPLTGTPGILAVNSMTFATSDSGQVTESAQQISEVGVFSITTAPPVYFSQPVSTAESANIGRFYPQQFEVLVASSDFKNACSGGFTYMDQPFEFDTPPVISIRALNAAGSKTENYEGEFWKLGVSLNRDSSCGGTGTNVGFCYSDNVAGAAGLTAPDSAQAYGATADIGGEVVLTLHGATTDTFRYTRPTSGLVTPFDADVNLTVSVRDSDLRAGASLASRIGFNGDTDAGGLSFNITNDNFLRYGRWQMENAFGPEISNLRIPASAEFYNAAGVWVSNTADICTNLLVDPVSPSSATLVTLTDAASTGYDDLSKLASVSIGTGTSAFSFDGPLALGDAGFNLTAPNSEGYVDIDVDLGTLNWLRFDWDGNGSFEDHGTVRATFGRYRGHDRIIYWKEVVQ